MRKKLFRLIRGIRKNRIENIFTLIISLIILGTFIFFLEINKRSLNSLLNETWKQIIATSVGIVGAALLAVLMKKIVSIIMAEIEDSIKLNPDYEDIIYSYIRSKHRFLMVKNDEKTLKKYMHLSVSYFDQFTCVLPEEYIFVRNTDTGFKLKIYDNQNKFYELPTRLEAHYDENLMAHSKSRIHNNIVIRVDKYRLLPNEEGIELYTSRTTYFDSLVTNRAIDYIWNNGISIRKMVTFNKSISSLEKTELSNHLGINAIITTTDQAVIGILRTKDASIGKGTYTFSVGAAVKNYSAENSLGIITESGIEKAVKSMIEQEIGLLETDYDFNLRDNGLAFYREWVEGGKPQLLFFVNCRLSNKEIETRYYNTDRKDASIANKKICFILLEDLKSASIMSDLIILGPKKKKFRVVPAVAGNVHIFRTYLNQRNN